MSCCRNKMNKTEFKNHFKQDQIFSLKSIRKSMPDFSYRQIDRWEKAGFLKKIKKEYYMFSDQEINQFVLFFTANKMYEPSYTSLESALKFYGLIPEEVFQVTSISTKKTVTFDTSLGGFKYRHIKPTLFWGYHFIQNEAQKILIADPEKAILDYLYLNPRLKSENDFKEMRINEQSFSENIDLKRFQKYLKNFNNKALTKRANNFLKAIQYD